MLSEGETIAFEKEELKSCETGYFTLPTLMRYSPI